MEPHQTLLSQLLTLLQSPSVELNFKQTSKTTWICQSHPQSTFLNEELLSITKTELESLQSLLHDMLPDSEDLPSTLMVPVEGNHYPLSLIKKLYDLLDKSLRNTQSSTTCVKSADAAACAGPSMGKPHNVKDYIDIGGFCGS